MKKKPDFKNFRLQAALSKSANEIMTMHPVRKEWRIAIVALLIIKLLTMAFSLFGGWNFFNVMFYGLFNDLEFSGLNVNTVINVFAVITLIAIELLTAVFLQKMFKFFYRHRFITALASGVVVALFYTISFISSTNGLAERQARKADESKMIKADFSEDVQAAEKEYKAETERINKQIARIEKNPQGWSEGKRSHLTAKQLANIASLQTELKQAKSGHKEAIKVIEQRENSALAENTVNTEKTAKDFYKVMAIIMAIQFIATGILVFFWHLIRNQESKDTVVSEDLREISNTVAEHAENLIFNTLVNTSNRIHYAVSDRIQQNKYIDALPVNEKKQQGNDSEAPQEPKPDAEKERVTITGFGIENADKKHTQKTHTKNNVYNAYAGQSSEKYMPYLRKHIHVVKAIINHVPENKTPLTNKDVRIIKTTAHNAKYNSDSLIRKVYEAVCSAGYDTVKENIN